MVSFDFIVHKVIKKRALRKTLAFGFLVVVVLGSCCLCFFSDFMFSYQLKWPHLYIYIQTVIQRSYKYMELLIIPISGIILFFFFAVVRTLKYH